MFHEVKNKIQAIVASSELGEVSVSLSVLLILLSICNTSPFHHSCFNATGYVNLNSFLLLMKHVQVVYEKSSPQWWMEDLTDSKTPTFNVSYISLYEKLSGK
jgi:hypothetical protein